MLAQCRLVTDGQTNDDSIYLASIARWKLSYLNVTVKLYVIDD